jgi:hypothetical protein
MYCSKNDIVSDYWSKTLSFNTGANNFVFYLHGPDMARGYYKLVYFSIQKKLRNSDSYLVCCFTYKYHTCYTL